MIKHLFNHHARSIIREKAHVNRSGPFPAKPAKGISKWAKLPKQKGSPPMSMQFSRSASKKEPDEAFIQKQLSIVSDFQMVADVFKQLGDTTRIRIFWLLCHQEECVLNISVMLGMSSPAVSHHLRPLKNSGLIVSRREGKEVYYHAADNEQSRLLHQMIEQVMEITCPR